MLEAIIIEASESAPSIRFDPDAGALAICGESYPEDAFAFFNPLMNAIETFLAAKPQRFHAELELIYFNSSTSKVLMDLFDLLEDAANTGVTVTVDWRYHTQNDVARENGEEFREDLDQVAFKLIELKD